MKRKLHLMLIVAGWVQLPARAAEIAKSTALTQGDTLAVPGVGRVLLVFVFISLLAVAAAYVVKRYMPSLARKNSAGASIKLVDSYAPSAKLRVYLLEVEGKRVLLADSASGVAMRSMETTSPSGVGVDKE